MKGYHSALYNFIQSLSEQSRGSDKVVLLASIPASEMPYSSDDEADEQWFKKMLDRVGKPIMMAAESETAEIIRRLFEWQGLNDDAKRTIAEYSDWIIEHRQQIPNWFPIDTAREAFAATYPLHPSVLSVFERKWQTLPRFQRTRGVLRLLALWVSHAYLEGFLGANKDPLIGLERLRWMTRCFDRRSLNSWGRTSWRAPSPRRFAGRRTRTPLAWMPRLWTRYGRLA